jgi:hypothetical protein
VDQVVLGHPLAQVRRQKHRRVTVNGDKSCGHGLTLPNFQADSKSDRLLGIYFWREGLEAALGPERRGAKGG